MGLCYTHFLISRDREFAPTVKSMLQFCKEMIALGVIPENWTALVGIESGKPRIIPNPFGGEPFTMGGTKWLDLPELEALKSTIGNEAEYKLQISGDDPSHPPFPLDGDQPLSVSVTLVVSAKPRLPVSEGDGDLRKARFWIEFTILNKFILPENSGGNILDAKIVSAAERYYGTRFVQGACMG